jgi:hypothetical protein
MGGGFSGGSGIFCRFYEKKRGNFYHFHAHFVSASHQGFWGETEALRDHGSQEEGTSSQEDNAQPKLGLTL